MDNNFEFEEIVKYKKKKQSNTSKSKYKSKHKHEYIDCLIKFDRNYKGLFIGSYCKHCGKIYSWSLPCEHTGNGYRALSFEEILEKYKHLEVFELKNFDDKYVPIEVDQNK